MNHIQFIEKNVREALIKQGYPESVAQGGAWQAIDLYRRMSQASQKGKIFDDVLRHARLWAEKQVSRPELITEKKKKQNKHPGLF